MVTSTSSTEQVDDQRGRLVAVRERPDAAQDPVRPADRPAPSWMSTSSLSCALGHRDVAAVPAPGRPTKVADGEHAPAAPPGPGAGRRRRARSRPADSHDAARISSTHSGPSVRRPARRHDGQGRPRRAAGARGAAARRPIPARPPRPSSAVHRQHPGRHLQAVGRGQGGRVDEGRGQPDEHADERPRPFDPRASGTRLPSARTTAHSSAAIARMAYSEWAPVNGLPRRADHPVVDGLVVGCRGRGAAPCRLVRPVRLRHRSRGTM